METAQPDAPLAWWTPLAALLAAGSLAVPMLMWRFWGGGQWAPAVMYAAAAGVGAWWCHTRLGVRATAAFIVAAAALLGLLVPIPVLELQPPT